MPSLPVSSLLARACSQRTNLPLEDTQLLHHAIQQADHRVHSWASAQGLFELSYHHGDVAGLSIDAFLSSSEAFIQCLIGHLDKKRQKAEPRPSIHEYSPAHGPPSHLAQATYDSQLLKKKTSHSTLDQDPQSMMTRGSPEPGREADLRQAHDALALEQCWATVFTQTDTDRQTCTRAHTPLMDKITPQFI